MDKPVQFPQTMRAFMEAVMHRCMRGWGHFAKSSGLSMPQFSIMMQLHYRGACGISDISNRFEISSAAASQLVEKLVHSGYLDRAEDLNDRRAKHITLSGKGRNLIERGIHEQYHWVDGLGANLDSEQQEAISKALSSLIEAFQKLETSQEQHR